ncbi:hypothetical protein ACFWA4_05970 [Streptomyces sp. NPDC060011]|uniref:hypothetical protein n=1 Tax=Streptomyces sp. NPDC060011 TaxID=3347037 RepID=UPI00368C7C64
MVDGGDVPNAESATKKRRPLDQVVIDTEAARLRGQERLNYREIGERMGCAPQTAYDRVQRAYKSALVEATDQARAFERERLDKLWRKAEEIANKTHFVTAHGKVVRHPESNEPLVDSAPVLQAYQEMRRVAESYRRLEGLDSPTKVEQTGSVTYEVVGVDTSDLA